jgi:gliding motility-associated-like protein
MGRRSRLYFGAQQPNTPCCPLLTTVYRVVQIEESCRGEDSVLVKVVQDITLKVNNDTTICSGDEIVLKAEGNGLRFNWLPDEGIENAAAGLTPAKPSGNITYGVKASIGNCIAVDSFRVNVIPYPLANAGQDKFICVGDSVMIGESFNANRFIWLSNGAGFPPVVPNPYVHPAQTTTYVLQVFEDHGCPKPGIDSVVVFVQPPVSLSVTRDTVIVVNQPLQLNASGAQRYQWIPSIGLSNTAIANPVALFSSPRDRVQYTLIGMNDGGCTDTVKVVVRVFANGPSIYVPTAFTPNGDGLNETLKPTLAGMQQFDYFRIFNRFGQLVFETREINQGWDGYLKGQKQPSGIFVWMVKAVDFEGKMVQAKGSTMLIR